MKRFPLILIFILATAASAMGAGTFNNETLRYRVEYKWGMVHKTAGNVTLSISNKGDKYHALLSASTAPWADKVYKVRDTLSCDIVKNGFLPVVYQRKAHEGGDRTLDVVKYSRSGSTTTGACHRKKWKDGKLVTDETKSLSATGTTLDMLSAFYYMRTLPYATWKPGQVLSVNIFSGKRKELLTIKYKGIEKVKSEKKEYNCYHVTFKFTSDGKKKSSDDIDAWISTDGQSIPIKLEGSLPIGKIRCFYQG